MDNFSIPSHRIIDYFGGYDKGNAGRSKHIALRYNIIREYVADGTIKVVYCPTSQMIADTLTKPLGKSLFSQHQNRLLNLTHPSS